ncbi:MAG: tetratricopeptide repeat protein [Planctomycetota bacterium]|jgi:Flp pilus assembly protein TadD
MYNWLPAWGVIKALRKQAERFAFRRGGLSLMLVPLLLIVCGGCGEVDAPVKAKPKTDEQALLAVLAENPDDMNSRLALANLYFDTGRTWSAIPVYQEFLKHRPNNPNVRTDLGTCYKRIGDLKRARAEFEGVVREYPNHVQAIYNLAVVINMTGDPLFAAELWEHAAEISTDPQISEMARKNAEKARKEAASKTSE